MDSSHEVGQVARCASGARVAAKAKKGKVHGRTPYGYRREYGIDEKGKRVLVRQYADPAEAKVVKGIFDRHPAPGSRCARWRPS